MAKQYNLSLNDFSVSPEEIENGYQILTGNNPFYSNLTIIFHIGMNDISLFPHIRLGEGSTYMDYLSKWIKGYTDAVKNPPSRRKASPKGSCSDPAIQTIIQTVLGVDRSFARQMNAYHNLFISAKIIQGKLLKEYISNSIVYYGWIWCNGNVLRSVDFCSGDGSVLLQVKNKSNTENSSSSAIRTGTTIKKWHRLGTQIKNGEKFLIYKWNELNKIINSHVITKNLPELYKFEKLHFNMTEKSYQKHLVNNNPCHMTEESYQKFLIDIAAKNPAIISDK